MEKEVLQLATNDKSLESFTFRIDQKVAEEINKIASINGASKSYVARQLILKGIEHADEIRLKVV